jgi:hypothetical protein
MLCNSSTTFDCIPAFCCKPNSDRVFYDRDGYNPLKMVQIAPKRRDNDTVIMRVKLKYTFWEIKTCLLPGLQEPISVAVLNYVNPVRDFHPL